MDQLFRSGLERAATGHGDRSRCRRDARSGNLQGRHGDVADAEYPPQSSLNSAGELEGFDIDVGRAIAERLGVEIEFVTPGWEVITAGQWNGRWDVSVGSMTPTEAPAEVLDFPAVYYYTPAALVVHEDNSTITGPAGASGRRIGVGVATTYENYLSRIW